MKVKTSVSLSSELMEHLSNEVRNRERSEFIEKAVWQYLKYFKRMQRDKRDIEIINNNADRLNAEAMDVLAF